jgi:hypothetical protein
VLNSTKLPLVLVGGLASQNQRALNLSLAKAGQQRISPKNLVFNGRMRIFEQGKDT